MANENNRQVITLRNEFRHLQFSHLALQKLLDDFSFDTVLDIGCGEGQHSDLLLKYGKKVTAIDYGASVYFDKNQSRISAIIADFNEHDFTRSFDCVWCSHILEHQLNVNSFLRKVAQVLNKDGVLAITVPPAKHLIVGGHVSLWNAGILLYNLILAGFNCKNASVLSYGYNISVIVTKSDMVLPGLSFDRGDLRKLKPYLPEKLVFHSDDVDDPFDGNIQILNW